ncbi:unnamed protein product [Dovyalis caffra]|uniref:Uncharacterized protein n=1 Tax=Dovyalis caffra TaxID=77055 RepID=A0AAV1RZ01_9ROSI|nr:unnamed protein product [Dovyalis caffra]
MFEWGGWCMRVSRIGIIQGVGGGTSKGMVITYWFDVESGSDGGGWVEQVDRVRRTVG